MRFIYGILAVFLLLGFFFTRWYLCEVRAFCEPTASLEIGMMIISGLLVGFCSAWLLGEESFRDLKGQVRGLLREKNGLHQQLTLLEKENQAARKHVADWQQEGSLLTQVKKVTEPLLEQTKQQVRLLEDELRIYQRRYDNLKEESDAVRRTAEQLRNELTAERAREAALPVSIPPNKEAEGRPATPAKPSKPHSRFTPATWQTRDDLTLISGIGPKIQKKLNELGIYSYRKVAEFTPDDIEQVTAALKVFKGRIGRDNWIGQAAALSIK
ncbi:MAG: hypothetical protein JNL40_11615 [Cyclobacteriaceae bacterium]|nr:hypothetical protein [Cyclobacteriaceae bacterium]